MDCRDGFRGFVAGGGGVGLVMGSALERILENAIGSVGRLGVIAGGSDFIGVPIATPLCRIDGEVMVAILGDREAEAKEPGGWPCEMGDRGGKVDATGDVYAPL